MTHLLASGLVIRADHYGQPAARSPVGIYVGVACVVVYLVVGVILWRRVVLARRNEPGSPLAHPAYLYVGRGPLVYSAVGAVMAGAVWWMGLQDVRATGPERWIWPWGEVLMWGYALVALGVLAFASWWCPRKARAIARANPATR